MPGTGTGGKLFFKLFFERFGRRRRRSRFCQKASESGVYRLTTSAFRVLSVTWLVVRKIIRREWLRRREEFVAPRRNKIAAPSTGSEFVLTFGTGRDDHGAAGGGTENQSSIRRDANNPSAHRTRRTSPLAVILRGTRAL